jgi:hypothetical protein
MVCDVAGRHRPHLGDHVFRKVLDSLPRPGTSEELLNLLFFDTLALRVIRRLGCGFRLLVEAFLFRTFRGIFCPLALFLFEDRLTLCFLAFSLCLLFGGYPGTFGFLGDFCLFREAGNWESALETLSGEVRKDAATGKRPRAAGDGGG